MKIKRNEPCPCGSGRKYKHCCLKKKDAISPLAKVMGILVFIVLLIIAVIAIIRGSHNLDDPSAARRVWSEEHQHWHYVQ